jgi:hypothetical protein
MEGEAGLGPALVVRAPPALGKESREKKTRRKKRKEQNNQRKKAKDDKFQACQRICKQVVESCRTAA